jgi:hypothetical protein
MFPPLAKSSHRRNTGAHRSPAAQSSLLVVQNRAGKLREGGRGAGARAGRRPPLRNRAGSKTNPNLRIPARNTRGQAFAGTSPRCVFAQGPKPIRPCASPPGTPSLRNRAGSKNKTEPALFPRCAFKTAHEAKSSSFASRGFREGNARGQAFARAGPRSANITTQRANRVVMLREDRLNREPLGGLFMRFYYYISKLS